MAFVFISLLLSSGGYIFYLLQKIDKQRQHILILNTENTKLKKTSWSTKDIGQITVELLACPCVEGTVKYDTKLYFAPVEWSPTLGSIKKSTKVRILEKSRIKGRSWYYIELFVTKNQNSRGWLVCEDVLPADSMLLAGGN